MDKERLVKVLKAVAEDAGHINNRLRELERAVCEIEEKIESADAWTRFASLTGMPEAMVQSTLLI